MFQSFHPRNDTSNPTSNRTDNVEASKGDQSQMSWMRNPSNIYRYPNPSSMQVNPYNPCVYYPNIAGFGLPPQHEHQHLRTPYNASNLIHQDFSSQGNVHPMGIFVRNNTTQRVEGNKEDVSFNLINIDHTLPSNRQNAISQLGDSEYKQVQSTSSTIFHDELLPVSQYEANPNFENETKINKNTLENETHPVSATYDDEIISNCNISPDILGCSEDSMYYKNTFSTLFEQADNTSSSSHCLSSSSQSLLLDTNIPTATINDTQNTAFIQKVG